MTLAAAPVARWLAAVADAIDQVIAAVAAGLFYSRLFTLDPALRPLFKGDIARRGELLMTMIGAAVRGLGNLGTLAPVVRQMGGRHAGYGLRAERYQTVGEALLWTLVGPGRQVHARRGWASGSLLAA